MHLRISRICIYRPLRNELHLAGIWQAAERAPGRADPAALQAPVRHGQGDFAALPAESGHFEPVQVPICHRFNGSEAERLPHKANAPEQLGAARRQTLVRLQAGAEVAAAKPNG